MSALRRLLNSHLGFLSVEGGEVVHLDLTGKEVAIYIFKNMDLHNVAVTPDGQRLIGVGTLMNSPDGLNPRMSKGEKRIAGALSPPPISCHTHLNNNISLTFRNRRLRSKQSDDLPQLVLTLLMPAGSQFSTTCGILPYREVGAWFSSAMKMRLALLVPQLLS